LSWSLELSHGPYDPCIVLGMGPNSQVGSGSGSTRNWTVATGLTTRKTRTIGNGPVSQPKTRHFKFPIMDPIKYWSSDRTMTWSVRTLCSVSHSFTSHCQICDRTNIRWVAIENARISLKIWCYFTVIQRIFVWSQIWKREVEQRLKLHNLHIHHVMICWDLRYLIGAKVAGTVRWNRSGGPTRPKIRGLMSGLGNKPAKTQWVGSLAGSGTKPNQTASQNPDRWRVTRTDC